MTAMLSKWGNSQGIRFPKKIIEELHLSAGDKFNIILENNRLILEPIKNYDIRELVKQIPKDYIPHEEFNESMGKEEW